jgi:hypothetical protein
MVRSYDFSVSSVVNYIPQVLTTEDTEHFQKLSVNSFFNTGGFAV